jgi:hypothetical protein
MRDREIRAALHSHLSAKHESDTRYIDELGICGTVRVDVAVINGTFSGYELKSDRDTLRRLPNQIELYSMVFDHATLVVGEKHYQHLENYSLLPSWWGIMVAVETDGVVILEEQRLANWNEGIDPLALTQLLWRDEMLEELSTRNLDFGIRSKPRSFLASVLSKELPLDELRDVVRCRLKTREGWRQLQSRESDDELCQLGANPLDSLLR